MKKLKLFIENFVIYGFGGIINKLIPMIMLPIVTRMMPEPLYYGLSDLSNTVISFGQAFAVCGMYDAMYRMFFEKEDEEFKKSICSTTLLFTIVTSCIVAGVIIVLRNRIAEYILGSLEYTGIVWMIAIATLVGATNNIVSAPTRMQNKRKIFLIMNTVSPAISYSVAIILLQQGCYFIALPFAAMIAGIMGEVIFGLLNRKWFCFQKVKIKYLKPLLAIAIPLLPNFLIYWIFNSSDKLMIARLLNTNAVGIYSIGAKLGGISQLIYLAFAGGWQYFAFSMMKEEKQVESNSRIFEYLGMLSFICAVLMFLFSHFIYQILFTEEYQKGYIVAPYLFLAPLLQMLFQVAANQFLVIKKTWPNLFILSLGAMVNVILNLYLIPLLGIEGAAIATLAGYGVADFICIVVLQRMKLMCIRRRFCVACFLMAGYIFVWRNTIFCSVKISRIAAVCVFLIYGWLYHKEIEKVFRNIKKYCCMQYIRRM